MGIEARIQLYQQMEQIRKRPLLVYVTSSRVNAHAQIAGDVIPEFLDQLQALPKGCKELDLLLVSNGGDPTVAWRVVSLIRERVEKFSVLVPQAAFSAATLIALGADEIVMHPHGNLGPTDPQIMVKHRNNGNGQADLIPFGSEDLGAFLKYARESVGLTDQAQLKDIFAKFCDEVGTVAIGVAARSSQLGVVMGEKLLQLHMTGDSNMQKARGISEKLTRDYFHHGYPVSRKEAKDIGLKVAKEMPEVEDLMWQIWTNLSEELALRTPFQPISLIAKLPGYEAFIAPPQPQVQQAPMMQPHQIGQAGQAGPMNPLLQLMAAGGQPSQLSTRFENVTVVAESARLASHYVVGGMIVALRIVGQPLQIQTMVDVQEWRTVQAKVPPAAEQPKPPAPARPPRARGRKGTAA